MRKSITIISSLFLLLTLTSAGKQTVYICTGPTAYAYHRNPNCSGLNRCGGSIKEVPFSDIQGRRSPCKKCY